MIVCAFTRVEEVHEYNIIIHKTACDEGIWLIMNHLGITVYVEYFVEVDIILSYFLLFSIR